MEQHKDKAEAIKHAQEVLIPEDPAEMEPKQTLDTGTPPIRAIAAANLGQWLASGWKDLMRAPLALLHGVIVTAVGLLILAYSWAQPVASMVFISGFLLVGPIFAVGVNAMAYRLEKGGARNVGTGLSAVRELGAGLGAYAGVLIILFVVWATVLWRWIGVLTVGELGAPATIGEVFAAMMASPQGLVSLFGVIAGGVVFALAVFALSVVTLPAMLDRQRGFVDAVAVSLKAMRTNFGTLLLWGLIITALFAVSVATALIALIVIFPWLGFAMWHGYRDVVEAGADSRGTKKPHPTHG
ncbi:MAG: DUF2189 domain-containing protein [Thioalkalivibrio sp.]|nr:MAG: DUF2189 domain-containing protein [Thioalkalivibrio sp.]